MSIEVGSIVEGRVAGITHFGAFVELGDGQTGLVHISEIADAYVKDVKDYLKEEDIVKVKVLSISDGKVALSIKQAQPRRNAKPKTSFEEMLNRFIKDSDERQSDLRRSMDSKRGGRGGPSRARTF
ncbi:MAG: S1 RNA-binding domain-containing protein [Firmicutes bacterium]|nr:S1 RNA-binding domain-containing protein [Bacillota bacterium]